MADTALSSSEVPAPPGLRQQWQEGSGVTCLLGAVCASAEQHHERARPAAGGTQDAAAADGCMGRAGVPPCSA